MMDPPRAPSRRTRDYISTFGYVASALLLGFLNATAQGFSLASGQGVGVMLSPLVWAGAVYGIERLLRRQPNFPRLWFWAAVIVFTISMIPTKK